MPTKEDILRKVKALLKFDNSSGATEGEILTAASKARELMEQYSIEEAEVKKTLLPENVVMHDFVSSYKELPGWVRVLSGCIAFNFGCKVVLSHLGNKALLHFIGFQADAEISAYFYEVVYDQLWKISNKEMNNRGIQGSEKTSFRHNFCVGACDTISSRIREQREVERKEKELLGQTFALQVVDARVTEIKKFVDQKFGRLRHTSIKAGSYGYSEGQEAGKKIHLNRGISKNDKPGYLPG